MAHVVLVTPGNTFDTRGSSRVDLTPPVDDDATMPASDASTTRPITSSIPTCFVIGPIGDEHDPIGSPSRERYELALYALERIILPACDKFGIVPLRADQIARMGEIPEQVFAALRDRDLVIADVSDANPNVMYELALRHSTGKCAILIGQHDHLPFDISWLRTIQFTRTPLGLVEGRERLEAAIAAFIEDGCDRVTATRILRDREQATDVAAPDRADPDPDVDAPGFVDLVADMESAFPRLTATLAAISAEVEQAGNEANRGTQAIEAADAQPQPMQARLLAVARYAEALGAVADRIDGLVHEYGQEIAAVDGGIKALLDRLEADPALSGEAPDFLPSLLQMGASATSSGDTSRELAASVEALAPLARSLRAPARRFGQAIRTMVEITAPVHDWAVRAAAIQAAAEAI